ncbi:class III extradiol dioxygenase subunit B-like domain-containing protein [Kribbella sp. CA-293567]|uniref:class III extradiol dioxygenase subunit B-like domain-containing protein n=1 Tax=Kribbella sp. CA-293567 TaxID=3002436 RepID=UPI0022DDA285|nr:class III extradiol dioxygenase subunit B-like domain-containing protein [Kribbella sp. CA-293567]WBQ07251.1 class III extradiol dioxygenase subunit B-like domain-containing protein [Kribbella sp. CA-293567]
MAVVSAAVCPHPPLLIPEVAGGAAAELDDLRAACLAAVDQLAEADSVVIVGSGPATGTRYDAAAGGSFGLYGAHGVRVGTGDPVLPLSLAVGAWLIAQSKAANLPRFSITVAADETPAACLDLGRRLAHGPDHIGLLVMGDGSPRRSEHSPVHLHPRAELFDTTVAAALDLGDTATLAALDPELAAELHVAGRAPWQVLAGATSVARLRGHLGYHAAPYGVGYFVASWTLEG